MRFLKIFQNTIQSFDWVARLVNRTKFQSFLIFAISFSFFLFFQFQIPDFLGRDAYYHLKMAKFISEGKFVFTEFPWSWFTVLRENFVDQHFLFHLLLAPFLVFGNFISPFVKGGIEEGFFLPLYERGAFGDFLGAKIATALFSSLAIFVFYLILKKNKIFGAFFWTILLLGASSGFIFRMNLVQAQGLALMWLFLGFLALSQKKYFWLLPISFFYSWTHGGFILILVMALIWCFVGSLNLLRELRKRSRMNSGILNNEASASNRKIGNCHPAGDRPKGEKLRHWWRSLFMIFKPLWFVLAGLILGILLHPYFPDILPFLKTQLFETGPFAKIKVGAEWYPYAPKNLFFGSSLVFVVFVSAIFILIVSHLRFVISRRKPKDPNDSKKILQSSVSGGFLQNDGVEIFTLFFLSIFFFLFTLCSQRFIEYLTPFSLFFAAFALSPYFKNFFAHFLDKSRIFQRATRSCWKDFSLIPSFFKYSGKVQDKDFFAKITIIKFFSASLILVLILFGWLFNFFTIQKSMRGSYHQEYQKAGQWLKNNTPKRSIITNLDWSDFPPLFYYNDQNYYIAGLDPMFFYQYDKNLYRKYEDFLEMKNLKESPKIFKKDFKTSYLVINNKFKRLEEKIKQNKNFQLVNKNDYLRIYKIN